MTRVEREKILKILASRLFDNYSEEGWNISDILKNLHEMIMNEMNLFRELKPPFLKRGSCFISNGRKCVVKSSDSIRYGSIETKDGRFIIKINREFKKNDVPLFRDILSHEIGHTYFYDISGNEIKSFESKNSFIMNFLFKTEENKEKEILASEIGRYILMPDKDIEKYEGKPGLETISRICKEFNVSMVTAAKRLIEDPYKDDEDRRFFENTMFVIEKVDNKEREIMGKFPDYKPFSTVNDRINSIIDGNDLDWNFEIKDEINDNIEFSAYQGKYILNTGIMDYFVKVHYRLILLQKA